LNAAYFFLTRKIRAKTPQSQPITADTLPI